MRKIAPKLSSLNSIFLATAKKVRRESIPTFPCKVSLQLEKGALKKLLSLFLAGATLKNFSVMR